MFLRPRYTIFALAGLLSLGGCAAPRDAAIAPPTSPTPVQVAAAGAPPTAGPLRLPTELPLSPTAAPASPTAAPASPTAAPAEAAPAAPTERPAPTAMPASTREEIFAQVWGTINENYLYSDFRGVDWLAVREEFAPQVAAATSNEEFFQLMEAMVGRLGDRHSRFLGPSAAQEEDVLSSGREERVGIGVITVNLSDAALIQQVFPDSPAAEAGLLPRDRIVAIDGRFYAQSRIEGPDGSQVRLTVFRPGEEESRDVVLTRRLVEGRIVPTIRRLEGGVVYVGVNTLWVNDMAEQVGEGLRAAEAEGPIAGVIIDLRGNPGGWRSVLVGMLSYFVEGEVGRFTSRREPTPLVIEPAESPTLQGQPLAVLIDGGTASYAELMAGVLQQETGAVVLGAPSAGNTETIYAYELAGGARLWVAQEGFELRGAVNLEGVGVQPDVLNTLDWTRYSEERDPMILEATRLLMEQGALK